MKLLTILLWIHSASLSGSGHFLAEQLKTDLRTNPLGFDNASPMFSWIIESDKRDVYQHFFEIIVGSDSCELAKGKGNSWHSGKVESHKTFEIRYKGNPLTSFTRYYWKVRIWDQKGNQSEWSKPAWFETAVMKPGDFKAEWISDTRRLPKKDEDFYDDIPNPLFRKEILIRKEISSARLYIAGMGYSIAYMNGKRIGDHMLDMPWTQYNKQVMYSTFDVTGMMHKGKNVIAAMLGNGWYNPMPFRMFLKWNLRENLTVGKPCLKAMIRIVYTDGTIEIVFTDRTWKAGEGPVLMNSVYLGETYDARLEQKGWNNSGFDDSRWKNAIVIDGPVGHLTANYIPPIRATTVLKPVKITEIESGKYIFDFGQNFAGVPRLRVKGPAGTKVLLQGGEDVHADGSLNFLTVIAGQLKSIWNRTGGPGCPADPMMRIIYTLKGDSVEVFTPEFTFSGFRYIEVSGFPGKPDLNSLEGLRMNTDLKENGSFECSNSFFNRLQEVIKWTFLSNVFSVQSDCPAREKLGYGADMVVTSEAYCYNFDMSSFYRKVIQDFANDARPSGGMSETAPDVGINDLGFEPETGPPGWQLAFPYGLKVLYDYYGDQTTTEKHYYELKKQVNYMHSLTPSHIVQYCISDHESLDPRPVALSATAFYYHHVLLATEFAKILGYAHDVTEYQNLASEIREEFIKVFLKPGTGVFDSGTQAAQAIALFYNMVPENEKDAAFNRLLSEIYIKHRGHLSTGIFGTKFMFDILRKENRNDVSYALANQRTFPGWGNMLANGATTLYESWEYPDTLKSQNHPMFGSISEWFYKSLLGINSLEPGFTKFEIRPQPAGDLMWARGHYDAVTGRITSQWKIEGTHFYLDAGIPANTRALIYVPSLPDSIVTEDGHDASVSEGLKYLGYKNGYSVFEAASGHYSLSARWQR